MSMDYIRKTYGVPAKRGGRVLVYHNDPNRDGNIWIKGAITGARGPYLRVRLDGEKFSRNYHPAWQIRYLAQAKRKK